MSKDVPIPKRWRDGPARDPLTQLMRKALAPQLSATQLEALRGRITQSASAPAASGVALGSAAATFVASAVLGGVLGAASPTLRPPRAGNEFATSATRDSDPPIESVMSIAEPASFDPMAPNPTVQREAPAKIDAADRPVRKAPVRLRRVQPAMPQAAHQVPIEQAADDSLLDESRLLHLAMSRWRKDKAPQAALELLDEYVRNFPAGTLRPEADFLRINLLLSIDRPREALTLLDRVALSDGTPRALELRIVRGELRARAGRCSEAIEDFSVALASVRGALAERATQGLARCQGPPGGTTR